MKMLALTVNILSNSLNSIKSLLLDSMMESTEHDRNRAQGMKL